MPDNPEFYASEDMEKARRSLAHGEGGPEFGPWLTKAAILIVDDEPGNIHVLKRMLNSVGYHNITSTTDGRQHKA